MTPLRASRRSLSVAATALIASGLLLTSSLEGQSPAPAGTQDTQRDATPAPESALEGTAMEGQRAAEGKQFPSLKLEILRPGSVSLTPLDLSADVGKRPIVFV